MISIHIFQLKLKEIKYWWVPSYYCKLLLNKQNQRVLVYEWNMEKVLFSDCAFAHVGICVGGSTVCIDAHLHEFIVPYLNIHVSSLVIQQRHICMYVQVLVPHKYVALIFLLRICDFQIINIKFQLILLWWRKKKIFFFLLVLILFLHFSGWNICECCLVKRPLFLQP